MSTQLAKYSSAEAVEAKLDAAGTLYGVVTDGATDNQPVIQAEIDRLAALGGGTINLPTGIIAIASELVISTSNIKIVGQGADVSHDATGQGTYASTTLKSTAPFSLTASMLRIEPASTFKISGCGVSNIFFNGNNLTGIALSVISHNFGCFEGLMVWQVLEAAYVMTTKLGMTEAADPQYNKFTNCSARLIGASSSGVLLDGKDTSANTSLNLFENIQIVVGGGVGFDLNNCDENVFIRSGTIDGGGSGKGIYCHGSTTSAADVPRNNLFIAYSGSLEILAENQIFPSYNNKIMFADTSNGTPLPTIEAGASFFYDDDSNNQYSKRQIQMVVADSATNASTAVGALANEAMRVFSASSNHCRLQTASAEWGISINNSSGNLTFSRITGTGYIDTPYAVKTGGTAPGIATVGVTTTLNQAYRTYIATAEIDFTIPGTSPPAGTIWTVKNTTVFSVAVKGTTNSKTIDGSIQDVALSTQNSWLTIQFDGTGYWIIGQG